LDGRASLFLPLSKANLRHLIDYQKFGKLTGFPFGNHYSFALFSYPILLVLFSDRKLVSQYTYSFADSDMLSSYEVSFYVEMPYLIILLVSTSLVTKRITYIYGNLYLENCNYRSFDLDVLQFVSAACINLSV